MMMTVTVSLDDKSLLINTFARKVYVTIKTLKDGLKQLLLSFSFDLSEWLDFPNHEDELQWAVTQLQYSGPDKKRVAYDENIRVRPGCMSRTRLWPKGRRLVLEGSGYTCSSTR